VVRSPEQLRLHRALEELGWTGVIGELNDAAGRKNQSVPEPILIATDGTILAGFGRWRLAVFEGTHEIPASNIHSVSAIPYSSYSPATKPGADGIRLSAFVWR
jgi:hypothetical protein